MQYLGCSYGYLIFSCREHFLLVDAYTGNKVKPPKLVANHDNEIYYAILMAPLSSPSSCLLLCSQNSMFQWQVGTSSWTEHPLVAKAGFILQIVFFKGQLFAMNFDKKLSTISLAPHLSMKEVAVVWGDDMVVDLSFYPRLVVCGDMLLMVDLLITGYQPNDPLYKLWSQVFRCYFSAKPAKWVKMEKLENSALFVSFDRKNPTFSCMSPERWGGRSNCIYVPSASKVTDEPWIVIELGQAVYMTTHPDSYMLEGFGEQFESLWVLPSLVYGAGR